MFKSPRLTAFAAILVVVAGSLPALANNPELAWSPDHKLFAVELPGQQIGKGIERERLVIYSITGDRVAIAHVWDVEPDGTMRAGIRGCEIWGWIDAQKLFCEGSVNPHVGVYLTFDANTGRELGENITTDTTP